MNTPDLRWLYVSLVVGTAAVAFGCTSSGSSNSVAPIGHATPTPSPTPKVTPTPLPTVTPKPTPTPTTGPTTTPTPIPTGPTPTPSPTSASTTEPLLDSGGSGSTTLTLPTVGGFTGNVDYASNNAPAGEVMYFETSVLNINSVPPPPSGTPIFYTRVCAYSGSACTGGGGTPITFAAGSQTATVTSSTLNSSTTYTLCAFLGAFAFPAVIEGSPSPSNPHTLVYPSPLTQAGLKNSGGQLPTNVFIDLEFIANYAGGPSGSCK